MFAIFKMKQDIITAFQDNAMLAAPPMAVIAAQELLKGDENTETNILLQKDDRTQIYLQLVLIKNNVVTTFYDNVTLAARSVAFDVMQDPLKDDEDAATVHL